MPRKPKAVTKSEFADAIDVSRSRISQMIRDGLPVNPDGTINLTAGKRWYAKHIDQHRREARKPSSKKRPVAAASTSETRGEKLRWEAQLRQLEFRKRSGDLVDRAATERVIFERARAERDRLLGAIPRFVAKISAVMSVDERQLTAVLDGILRDHLTELAATTLKDLQNAA